MKKTVQASWSDTLIAQTRALLEDQPGMPGVSTCMKHIDGRFGVLIAGGATPPGWTLMDRDTGTATSYATVDAIIAAGWAID